MVEDEKLLKKYNEIWSQIKNTKKFDKGPVFDDKYLRTKTKSYNEKTTTNFKNVKNNDIDPPIIEESKSICL